MFEIEFTHVEVMFLHALTLITAACFFVPIFKKTGLGSILGFLVAGIVVNILFSGRFAEHPEELLHYSEFGVVLFLFVIGLELQPSSLWRLRGDIFGLGLAQMLGCGLVIAVIAYFLKFDLATSVVIGLGMALSSTAIVMSQLDESGERSTFHGRKTFSILLFQDLAIVPLLLLVTLLAPSGDGVGLIQSLINTGIAIASIVLLVIVGKYLLDPLFRLLAKTKTQEIMTASALGIVIAAALLMDVAGMSYAMGAFIAGVMLAESSYRHEVEANIEPFRGLFLGLFFMAVGLSLDLNTVIDNWYIVILGAVGAILVKAVTIYGTARLFKNSHDNSIKVALSLPQLGEFGFVLFAAATTAGLLIGTVSSTLVAVISVSMALSPLVQKLIPALLSKSNDESIEENFDDVKGSVLIIGFGRFGQVVSQPLFSDGIEVTILDNDAERIREASKFGFRVHYGDGTRRDILRAAGIKHVEAIIICTDKPNTTHTIVDLVKSECPSTKIYARSYDRRHSIELFRKDIDYSVRETFESALVLGEKILVGLGADQTNAKEHVQDIRKRDKERLKAQAEGDMSSGTDRLHIKPVVPEPIKLEE